MILAGLPRGVVGPASRLFVQPFINLPPFYFQVPKSSSGNRGMFFLGFLVRADPKRPSDTYTRCVCINYLSYNIIYNIINNNLINNIIKKGDFFGA